MAWCITRPLTLLPQKTSNISTIQKKNKNPLSDSIKMSCAKKIKNPRIRRILIELKNQEDVIDILNKIEELKTQIIIETTKRKLSAIENKNVTEINELGEDLRIEAVKRRMKEKHESFKLKNK